MKFALVVSVGVLGLLSMVIGNMTQQSAQSIQLAKTNNLSIERKVGLESSVATVKALLNESKLAGEYEPSVFGENYFETNWTLTKNDNRSSRNTQLEKNAIVLNSKASGQANAERVFQSLDSSLAHIGSSNRIVIDQLNRSTKNPFLVQSADITVTDPSSKPNPVTLRARIGLTPPEPKGMKILIKGPGDTDFNENWGSIDNPREAGLVTLRMIGSGVIHFGRIEVNGIRFNIGLDPETGDVTHTANNVKAKDVVIDDLAIDVKALLSDKKVKYEGCVIDSKDPDIPDDRRAIAINASVFAVTGEEAVAFHQDRSLIVKFAPPPKEKNSGLACAEMCPKNYSTDFNGNNFNPNVAAQLDLYQSPKVLSYKKLDLFEEGETAVLDKDVKGIVCSNLEGISKGLSELEGGDLPSVVFKRSPELFDKHLRDLHALKVFVSYVAPSCTRQVVSARDACGCFDENTLITMGDQREEKRIADLQVGDMVWNPMLMAAQRIAKVTAGPEKKPMFLLKMDDADILVTETHPFPSERGILPANALLVGDAIYGKHGKMLIRDITLISSDDSEQRPVVWNLTLEGSDDYQQHYLMANGIIAGDLFIQEALQKKAKK